MYIFKNISEVQDKWEKLYKEYGLPEKKFPRIGYNLDAIVELEKTLGIKLHDSFRKILQDFNLDNLEFHTINFGHGTNYLALINNWEFNSEELSDKFFINVGTIDGYDLIMDNSTGNIYYAEEFIQKPTYIIDNIDLFIRISASIIYSTLKFHQDDEDNEDDITNYLESFFEKNDIDFGHEFWRMLAFRSI